MLTVNYSLIFLQGLAKKIRATSYKWRSVFHCDELSIQKQQFFMK